MEGMERGRVWGADESQEVIGRECHDGHRCRHAAGAKTGRRDPADKAAAEEQGRDDGHGGATPLLREGAAGRRAHFPWRRRRG